METSGRETEEVSCFGPKRTVSYNTVMPDQKLLYHNITISGRVGTGKNTLLQNLKPYLEPLGWKFYSGGDYMRQFVAEHKLDANYHHKATDYNDDVDRKVDFGRREKLEKEERQVFEGWLAGYTAQGIPGVLKVLLVCSNPALVIDRLVNRDNITVEEAKQHMYEREEENTKKWKRMYGNHDFWDPKLYDLVIDTYSSSRDETLHKVLDALGYPLKSS